MKVIKIKYGSLDDEDRDFFLELTHSDKSVAPRALIGLNRRELEDAFKSIKETLYPNYLRMAENFTSSLNMKMQAEAAEKSKLNSIQSQLLSFSKEDKELISNFREGRWNPTYAPPVPYMQGIFDDDSKPKTINMKKLVLKKPEDNITLEELTGKELIFYKNIEERDIRI